MTFRDIPLGSTFRFESELALGYQGARGPWVKLTPRKYRHEEKDALSSIEIGTVKAACRIVAALSLLLALAVPALAEDATPKAPRVKPAVVITVKLYSDDKHAPKVELAKAGCIAWVAKRADLEAGFRACLAKLPPS